MANTLKGKLTPKNNMKGSLTNEGRLTGQLGGVGAVVTYASLPDKPSINNVELVGNKTTSDLKISYNDLRDQPAIPDVGEIDERLDDLESDTSALDTRLTTAEGNITSLGERVTTAEGNITTLQGDTSALDTRLTTAEGNITSLGGRVTTAEGNITSLGGRVTTAEGNITTLQGDTSALDTRLTTAEENITSLGGRLTTAEGNITSLDGRVTTNEGDISDLQGDVSQAQSDILQLNSTLSTIITGTREVQYSGAGFACGCVIYQWNKFIVVTLTGYTGTSAIPAGQLLFNNLPLLRNVNELFITSAAGRFRIYNSGSQAIISIYEPITQKYIGLQFVYFTN